MFTEYGHRWLDLKRTGAIDSVMSIVTPEKGGSWNTTAQLFAIPFSEILQDPNIKQKSELINTDIKCMVVLGNL